jgi:hypothetical protein
MTKKIGLIAAGLLLATTFSCKNEQNYNWDNPYDSDGNYGSYQSRENLLRILNDETFNAQWEDVASDGRSKYGFLVVYFYRQGTSNNERLPDFTDANKPGIYIENILENANAATEKDYTYPAMPNPFICSYKMDQLDHDREDVHVYVGEDDQRFVEQTAYFKRAEISEASFSVQTDMDGRIIYGAVGGGWNLNESVWNVAMGQNFQLHLVTSGQLSGSPSGHYLLSLVSPPGFMYADNMNNTDPYIFGTAPAMAGPYNFGLMVQDADNYADSHAFYGLQIMVTNGGGGGTEMIYATAGGKIFRDSNYTNFDGFAVIGETFDSGSQYRPGSTYLEVFMSASYFDFNTTHTILIRDDQNPTTWVGNGAMYGSGNASWLATQAETVWKPGGAVFRFYSPYTDAYRIERTNGNIPMDWTNAAFVGVDIRRNPRNELNAWRLTGSYLSDYDGDGDPYYSGGFHQCQGILVFGPPMNNGFTNAEISITFNANSLTDFPENVVVMGMPASMYYGMPWANEYLDGSDMAQWAATNMTPATNFRLFEIPKWTTLPGGTHTRTEDKWSAPRIAMSLLSWANNPMGDSYVLVFAFWKGESRGTLDIPGAYLRNGVVNNLSVTASSVSIKLMLP